MAAQLKTGCVKDDSPTLFLDASAKVAFLVPLVSILLPSLAFAMASTVAFAVSIAAHVTSLFSASTSTILIVLVSLLKILWPAF